MVLSLQVGEVELEGGVAAVCVGVHVCVCVQACVHTCMYVC